MKLIFIGSVLGIGSVGLIIIPFVRSFEALIAIRCIQNVLLGAFITADCTIPIFTMGPDKSRPFTNALHAMVGVGFLAGTILVRPFLPADATAAKDRDEVCLSMSGNATATAVTTTTAALPAAVTTEEEEDPIETLLGIDKIAWPFIITGVWCVFFSFGYIILGERILKQICTVSRSHPIVDL
jgi:hypothetical protein